MINMSERRTKFVQGNLIFVKESKTSKGGEDDV